MNALSLLKKHKQLLPLLALTALCFNAIVAASRGTVEIADATYAFELTSAHYAALVLVGLCYITYAGFKRSYKYFLVTALLLGLFNIIVFTSTQTTVGVGLGSLRISVQPAILATLILTYFLNFERVNSFILAQLGPSPANAERRRKQVFEEEVSKFKTTFQRYPSPKLADIVESKTLVPAALEAARQLLRERG
jgi:hypothetical protein